MVPPQTQTHSIGIGGDHFPKAERSTDVINLVNVASSATNTNKIQTDEKQMGTIVDTKEVSAQMIKDVKEAFCDGTIQTENKVCQSQFEGKEKEINCQLLRG